MVRMKMARKTFLRYFALFVIVLFLNLPVVSALQISGVQSSGVTHSDAIINWETDEAADSVVRYGTDPAALSSFVSGSSLVTEHNVGLGGLDPESEYFFEVESGGVVDDNAGAYYSFMTLADPAAAVLVDDTDLDVDVEEEAAEIDDEPTVVGDILVSLDIPEIIAGIDLDFSGSTTEGADVRLYVNGQFHSKVVAGVGGGFSFTQIDLLANEYNVIEVEATLGESVALAVATVFSDATRPELTLDPVPLHIFDDELVLSGSVSEETTIVLEINGARVFDTVGTSFSFEVKHLDEGENDFVLTATDVAGFTAVEDFVVIVDTMNPDVEAVIEKGNEYYQGSSFGTLSDPSLDSRTTTDISGTTEAGAELFLFVYKQLAYEYAPTFDDPVASVFADAEGNFVFEDINFAVDLPSLDDFTAIVVPPELEGVSVVPETAIEQAQTLNYHFFIVAVDVAGRTGSWREIVQVHTCYSENFDFQITNLPEFQRPYRLDPGLLDDGREEAHAVFELEYRGDGYTPSGVSGPTSDTPYKINNVEFQEACTQSMLEGDDIFALGCNILPSTPSEVLANPDASAHYLTWRLFSSEKFSDTDDDFWNEYQDRTLKFPLKVSVKYQEYDAQGNLGPSQTQSSCYDLVYHVDIPLESEKLIPDVLAEDAAAVINKTLEALDTILPYVEKAVLVTGISCFVSLGVKTVVRFARIFASKAEVISGQAEVVAGTKNANEVCPLDQSGLYLEKTRNHWDDLKGQNGYVGGSKHAVNEENGLPSGFDSSNNEQYLEERCPQTASMWKAEAILDDAYLWTCDRFLCRAVPAKWTEDEQKPRVDAAYLSQQACAVTAGCTPLRKFESCEKHVKDTQGGVLPATVPSGTYQCWEKTGSELPLAGEFVANLYYKPSDPSFQDNALLDKGVVRLQRASGTISTSPDLLDKDSILAYQEPGSDNLCGAQDFSCSQVCARNQAGSYTAVEDGWNPGNLDPTASAPGTVASTGACYKQTLDAATGETILVDGKGEVLNGRDKYAAGFTNDCFVGNDKEMYQCVCQGEPTKQLHVGKRTAAPKDTDSNFAEKYSYRQDRLYQESNGVMGTYYPEWRYYVGRDVSGAFGFNHISDYFRPDEQKKFPEINPKTQPISTWQALCLSGIYNQLRMVQSILQGLGTCIEEAKYTGLKDAGMCKTLFTQHVCGLFYKVIAAGQSQCTPSHFQDASFKGDDGLGAYFSAGTDSFYEALDSGFDDLENTYGNAQLTNYFGAGVQGFTESMCLAAFGFDFPIGNDFIMDTAYSVSSKTSALVLPATREFSHYNPASLTAVYNYEVGAAVFPGCKVARYDTLLRCVNTEDLQYPGVVCESGQCDCLNAFEQSPFESEREILLPGGSGFQMDSGAMIDLPIEVPQKIDKHFRYDHVVVRMTLEPGYEQEDCFEPGQYWGDNGGVFYYPITDVTPGTLSCQVESTTGQYSCSALSDIFYGGSFAFLEAPYLACYDKNSGLYRECNTPNLFTLDGADDIKFKTYMNTDDKGYCLEVETTGTGVTYGTQRILIPKGSTGQRQPEISLGPVTSAMFGAQILGLEAESSSALTCPAFLTGTAVGSPIGDGVRVQFTYEYNTGGFKVREASGSKDISIRSSGYSFKTDGTIVRDIDGITILPLSEINGLEFEVGGVSFKGILGSSAVGNGACNYRVQDSDPASGGNERTISVTARLLETDPLGGCYSASEPVVASSSLGRSSAETQILIQQSVSATGVTSPLHTVFVTGDYVQTQTLAEQQILASDGTLDEVIGIYYFVAATIAPHGPVWASSAPVVDSVKVLLDRFFLRRDAGGVTLSMFDETTVQNTAEFQSVRMYLCSIADDIGVKAEYGPGAVPGYYCP